MPRAQEAETNSPVKMSSELALVAGPCLLLLSSLLLQLQATAWEDKDFFSYCPPSRCSEHGPEIRFPFQLESNNNTRPSSCSVPCMKLACSGQDTILDSRYSYLGSPYKVTAIDYKHTTLTIIPIRDLDSCPLLNSVPLPSQSLHYHYHGANWSSCDIYNWGSAALVSCSEELTQTNIPSTHIAGPISFSCLSTNSTHFSYLVAYDVPTFLIPIQCEVVSDGPIPIPYFYSGHASLTFRQSAERILNFADTTAYWRSFANPAAYNCSQCEQQGRRCAYSSQRNQTFCMRRGSHVKVIAATSSVAAFVILLLMVATALYLSLRTRYNEEIHLKVEMFLKTYGTSKPTRYTFSEVKKIASRFKVKVGQGGFGSVYRGELPNGVPVAVKMLENSKGEGDEFINEVATIGRIHHANIVRLLGFCSEGTRRALIYEYMPNDSLEKYIFSHDSDTSQEVLVPNKMLDIALGIARGMEYLHQGCNQRILHFDIKPHNILLDYNFSPKISDFGLAKLCARDQSIVTLTAARGTMGYIAPELYSRNFGEISYKSDVYSFGMLVLEMVSGRRNSDPSVESQNMVYFPEWIYEQVTAGQDLALGREMTEEEKATTRQLAIVALWCIQWNPNNRPSMTKVVNMLTGRLQNLQMRGFVGAAVLLVCNLATASAWKDKDFFSACPAKQCGKVEIRYPFRFEPSNTSSSCGLPCMKLTCSDRQETILDIKNYLGRPYKVTAIDYKRATLTIVPLADDSSLPPTPGCPLPNLISEGALDHRCEPYAMWYAALVSCSSEFAAPATIPDAADYIAGPISCLSNKTHFFYTLSAYAPMSFLPLDCEAVSGNLIALPRGNTYSPLVDSSTLKDVAERIFSFNETPISWISVMSSPDQIDLATDCRDCETQGRRCAFSSQRNQTFCMPHHHGSRVRIIAATSSAAALVVLLLLGATVLYLSLKTRYNEEIHLKVEMFLKTYGTSKPTRYSFSEVKKIARRFKIKLGQGGFGSVYRGELPNGVPVAVKMLENSKGEGEEFINEVSTIGRIHHANIVRLLGFCSEGTRRALIYEFMPNESLEKYIFSDGYNILQELLVPNKMLDIALGIARGMEYLHQGCNQRILHFDIKPHNILLDYNFSPKISDFGLAKLCARDQSIVTLTAARGTMGYIAPELYSRNFGEISYKSDVYSFGMLVLEMVSGRRNSDPSVESQNVVYFPEWIYEQVNSGQDLALGREMTQEEKETVRQLAIVALWCIQWNPKNRPSMTKVVNMLTGRLQNLQVPPKPFLSADSYPVL
uniref:Protein kinase domain-containing protein n=1 Tax=Oryza barthii TaxID=65489 RepID=A0A0D3EIY3_9ORYZ